MDQRFNVDHYVAREQLLFGLDEIQGLQYADAPNNDLYHQLPYGAHAFSQLSTSPDVLSFQSQYMALPSPEMPGLLPDWSISSACSMPHHSFGSEFEEMSTSVMDYAAWNTSPTAQISPTHNFSSPVNIPVRSNHAQYGFLSPTSTVGNSYFSQGSYDSSHTSTSHVDSVTDSVTSFNTATEEPMQFSKQPVSTNVEMTGSSPFSMIQYSAGENTHRLTPAIAPGGKRPRGRTGPLNETQRRSTAHMRNVKACQSCRARKAKCDPGIPCRQCINYYKNNLVNNPCRGQQLEDIADKLLQGHIFPRKRALGTDFGANFRTWPNTDFAIYLTWGFGEPLGWSARIASPLNFVKFSKELLHEHVHYTWPDYYTNQADRAVKKQWVFPAMLTNTADLKVAVDEHLTKLIETPDHFNSFPRYKSPLVVLEHIYKFYLKLDDSTENKPGKKLLGQAFKLLNLIHIGGDTRVSPSPGSRRVLDHFFSPEIQEADVVPCYIRSQLGEVFAKLASEYMKEVLSRLEMECLNKNCGRFPIIVSTFLVLLMSIESLQHKTHKDPFHFVQDGVLAAATSANTVADEVDGMVDLLDFYKNCFAGCHRDRLLTKANVQQLWAGRNTNASYAAGETVVARLRDAIRSSEQYLRERSRESLITRGGDITVFFDRLVARMLLLEF